MLSYTTDPLRSTELLATLYTWVLPTPCVQRDKPVRGKAALMHPEVRNQRSQGSGCAGLYLRMVPVTQEARFTFPVQFRQGSVYGRQLVQGARAIQMV